MLFDFLKITFSAPDRFEPNSAEEQFLDDYARRFLTHRRAISILAVVYWTAFTGHRLLCKRSIRNVLTYVHSSFLGSVCLAGCAWLSFRKAFVNEHCATNVLIATVAIPYGLLGLMLLLVPFPINYMYYSPGLFMVMIFAYGMFRLRARPAIRLTLAFLLFSELVYAFMANDAMDQGHRSFSFYYFLFSSLYLTSFAVIGCAIVVELDSSRRIRRERQLPSTSPSKQNEELNSSRDDESRSETYRQNVPFLLSRKRRAAAGVNGTNPISRRYGLICQPMQALSNLPGAESR
jgi:hypothetical protein